MRLLMRFAEAVDARRFIDIEGSHVDGCPYLGRASLDFAERMVSLGGKVRMPTTLKVGSVDLIHPELFRGSKEHAANSAGPCARIWSWAARADLHLRPLSGGAYRPRFGAQIAWGNRTRSPSPIR